jgi:hypothetical protein
MPGSRTTPLSRRGACRARVPLHVRVVLDGNEASPRIATAIRPRRRNQREDLPP